MDVETTGVAPRSGVPGDGAASAGSPALGISTEIETEKARESRRSRYARRAEGQSAIRGFFEGEYVAGRLDDGYPTWVDERTGEIRPQLPKVCKCSWALGDHVYIRGGDGVGASWSQTQRCASIWACPVCSSVIRTERAKEIQQGVAEHQARGGSLVFVTLTLRHRRRHELKDTLKLLRAAYPNWRNDRMVKSFFEEHGYVGRVRALEITHGEANGWHPHLHILVFLDGAVSADETAGFKRTAFEVWKRVVLLKAGQLGLTAVTPYLDRDGRGGVDVQLVDGDGRVLARYLSKVQDDHRKWNVGAEMGRSDVKSGNEDNLTPFQLLDRTGDVGRDARNRMLFASYYVATKGVHAMDWSPHMKELYGIGDRTDEDIIADVRGERIAYRTTRGDYRHLRRSPSLHATVLDWAEDGDWDLVNATLPGLRLDEETGRMLADSFDGKG